MAEGKVAETAKTADISVKEIAIKAIAAEGIATEGIAIEEIASGRLTAPEIRARLSGGERLTFLSITPQETYFLGRMLGEHGQPGEVYTLTGDLGTGKTLFTQGFAAGLGIEEPVSSPTFTILQVYDTGRLPFYHFDVYRIGDVSEMEEVGWEDCIYGQGICMVEWAELVQEVLPKSRFHILIEKDPLQGFEFRRIVIYYEDSGVGQLRPGSGSGCGGE